MAMTPTAPRYSAHPRLPTLLKNFECRPTLPRWGSRWRDFLFGCTRHAVSSLQTYITRVDPRRLPTLIRGSCFLGRDSCALGRASSLSTSRACWNRCSGLLFFFAEQKTYLCLVLEKPVTSALCVSQQGERSSSPSRGSCFLGRDSCALGRAAYTRRRLQSRLHRIELRPTLIIINFTGVLEQV